jgi:predicted aspartyl protease
MRILVRFPRSNSGALSQNGLADGTLREVVMNKPIRVILALGFLVLLVLCANTVAEPTTLLTERNAPAKALAEWLKKQGYVPVPMTINKAGWLDVKVEVEGLPMLLMLDTGANNMNLHRPSAQRAKLPITEVEGKTAALGGTLATGQTKIAKLSVGALTSPAESYVVDLSAVNIMRTGFGLPPCDGILGGSFLVYWSAILDYPHAKLYLLHPERKPKSAAKLLKKDGYLEVSLELNTLAILDAKVEADGKPMVLFLDTGFRGTVSLDQSSAKTAKLAVKEDKSKITELGGALMTGSARFQRMAVGKYAGPADVHVTDFSTTNALRKATQIPFCDGTLNGGFFKERSAIIDYAHRKLYLRGANAD